MKKKQVHKYTPQNFDEHLCGFGPFKKFGCCNWHWKKVTCKKCLKLRGKK